ncbi:MAG TPA: TetR/AcrR family transcriptional regulator [Thermoplasmata archaeon]|nr:TetR/AcrR family transcriptional regulator [Thermoplasmata archaeon]
MVKNQQKSLSSQSLARILQITEELFAKRGYERVSMREIAEAAGISKGLIYYHFKDKEDLYYHSIKEGVTILLKQLSQAIIAGKTPTEKIKIFISDYFKLLLEKEKLVKILFQETGGIEGPVAKYIIQQSENIISTLASVIKEGINEGEFRLTNARLTAASLFGLLNVFVSEQVVSGEKVPVDILVEHTQALFLNGICV